MYLANLFPVCVSEILTDACDVPFLHRIIPMSQNKSIVKYCMITALCLWAASSFSQTVQTLYNEAHYEAAVAVADSLPDITKDEMYFAGRACMMLDDEDKAIAYYDKALQLDSTNQLYMSDKALALYYANRFDEAIACAKKAQTLPYETGLAYYLVPNIHSLNEDYDLALQEYYAALDNISPDDGFYIEVLQDIGRLEYMYKKDYEKAIQAYRKVIINYPDAYEANSQLIRAYYAMKNYAAGDSVFATLKMAYDNKELPDDWMQDGGVVIDEFEWNGRRVLTFKKFKTPEEMLDVIYKIYLISADGQEIERTLQTEQTIVLNNGPKHLLCEQGENVHRTYNYGWQTDDIDYEDLKRAAIEVFDGEMRAAASSSPGTSTDQEKDTGKKRKKKKKAQR